VEEFKSFYNKNDCMVFQSYVPQNQDPNVLREKITQLGYVGVDSGEDYEQYCKCNHRQCVELFANLKKELSKSTLTLIKEALIRKDTEYKPPERIVPDDRSLVTLFREGFHKPIGIDGRSGLSFNYIQLMFVGNKERYQEVLTNLPELPEIKEMHRKSKVLDKASSK